MKHLALSFGLSLALASVAVAQAPAPAGVIGPTLGHVDQDHALLWLRAPGVHSVQVEIGGRKQTLPFRAVGRGFGRLRLNGLKPDTPYVVRVSVAKKAPVELRFRTATPPQNWGKLRFGVGSCLRTQSQPVWKVAAASKPDLFVFLGDHVYYRRRGKGIADWDRVEWMLERQLKQRTRPEVLSFLRTTPNYSVWDDHDYGPNNSGREFPLRAESRVLHKYLWANPSYGVDGEGVHFSFRRGPVEFFLLDGRSFKEVRRSLPKEKRVIYGAAQLAWLKTKLRQSTAPLKVIGSGTQMLLGYPIAEGWQQAMTEKRAFMSWLNKANLGPVLFLSGDIHVSELYRKPLVKGSKNVVWELTSSGMAADAFGFQDLFELAVRPEREWVVISPNVCTIDVDIPRDPAKRAEATLHFRSLSSKDGKVMKETKTTFASFGQVSPPARAESPQKGSK
jgi:alkaline phosphatase D